MAPIVSSSPESHAHSTQPYVKVGCILVYTVNGKDEEARQDPYKVSMRFKGEADAEYYMVYQHKDFVQWPTPPRKTAYQRLVLAPKPSATEVEEEQLQRQLCLQGGFRELGTTKKEETFEYPRVKFLFYFTKMHSKVMIMDPSKIGYFPTPGVVPEELKQTPIRDYGYRPWQDEEAAEATAAECAREEAREAARRVGTIKVQVPKKAGKRFYFETERQQVFCDDIEAEEPFYYTLNGIRKQKADPERITFLPDRLIRAPQNRVVLVDGNG